MTTRLRIAAICCGVVAHFVPMMSMADSTPLAEAMQRGLVGKPASTARMSGARWNREQQAAIEKSESIMRRALQEPGLLAQYLWMRARYAADDDRVFRLVFGQYLSWFQTWIGDYSGARSSFSLAQPAQSDDARSPVDDGFRPRRADAAILELAKSRKAVFFNEAHSAPVTRTLTLQLLADLRAQGFDYFAAETLSASFNAGAQHAYPTARSGFYVDEPICGEMIRTALRLGYHVIAYDAEESAPGARERASAQSLYDQVFRHDPTARLVLNAGFSHIQKTGNYLGGSSMAQEFRRISGIEPLVIEQTMMIEHARAADDHPLYRAVTSAPHLDAPFVFQNASGATWTLKRDRYDVTVFFPRETLIDGRPDWLSLGGARQPFAVSQADCLDRLPCLIEARYAIEGDDAVAADRVAFEHADRSRLYLFPGRYRLSSSDRAGKIIIARDIVIDAADP